MSELQWRAGRWLDTLRTNGAVVVGVYELRIGAEAWQATMRKVARQAGLRIRTGLSHDGSAVWAYHVDHVVTPAEEAASVNTIASLITAGGGPSYAENLAVERRKRLRLVIDASEEPN